MARPIKETPVLRGHAAVKFLTQINSSDKAKATEEEKEKIRKDYEALKNISNF